jgi:hypothetical protein
MVMLERKGEICSDAMLFLAEIKAAQSRFAALTTFPNIVSASALCDPSNRRPRTQKPTSKLSVENQPSDVA